MSEVVDILPLQMLKSWSLFREQHLQNQIQALKKDLLKRR
ncbi:hypothetical protein D9757_012116 [Collybiopsis confluens]|uniref:Uncharacterized protein n=1 Tax=Collybiopsis confluens TaxID=2823264 RepID=A0A8H5GI62_9AGAR|nr:hypothetical protein D9757_012116 [Collybiopsis confluens]